MRMQLIRRIPEPIAFEGRKFRAAIYAEEQWDGAYHAWIAYFGNGSKAALLATDLQTVQPNRTALRWWADGLSAEQLVAGIKRAAFLESNPEERNDEPRSFAR
ncbi:MAG: hypothetical protein ACJ790_21820 [Myxococcaceae bacterium]